MWRGNKGVRILLTAIADADICTVTSKEEEKVFVG